MQSFTSDWVQAGELGFAFVVVILCAALVIYVIRSSAKREESLLAALMQSNVQLKAIADVLQQLKTEITDRLEHIEDTLNIKPKKRAR